MHRGMCFNLKVSGQMIVVPLMGLCSFFDVNLDYSPPLKPVLLLGTSAGMKG